MTFFALFAHHSLAVPASAQTVDDDITDDADETDKSDFPSEGYSTVDEDGSILVVAPRYRGSVITTITPIAQLNADDIASFGASSIAELMGALSDQINPNGENGSGQPVILINGRRVSGIQAIRNYPPEALLSVEIFPEELALQYGYRADQRVVNFIFQENYSGGNGQMKFGMPTRGKYAKSDIAGTFTQVIKDNRFNIGLRYGRAGRLTQAERGIIQLDDAAVAANLGEHRTFIPPSDDININAAYSRAFASGTSLSLSGGYSYRKSLAWLGLPSATLDIPPSSPFATSSTSSSLFRYFGQFGPLERNLESGTAQAGLALNGELSGWHWTVTANYNRSTVNTTTDRSVDSSILQTAVNAGSADPFAGNFGSLLTGPRQDEARSVNQNINSTAIFSGTLIELPAGRVITTLRTGYGRQILDSRNNIAGAATFNAFRRSDFNGMASISIPLANKGLDIAAPLGNLSILGNFGFTKPSDFSTLMAFGFGLNWQPFHGLSITASALGAQVAPAIGRLGDPAIITPDVTVFDFARGETVLVDVITGSNPNLSAQRRRDIKLAGHYSPKWVKGLSFTAEYSRNRNENVTSGFPTLTPEIEAAFPGRVTRDNNGRLTLIDRRPVNYSNRTQERVRYGFRFFKRLGKKGSAGAHGARKNPGHHPARSGNGTKPAAKNLGENLGKNPKGNDAPQDGSAQKKPPPQGKKINRKPPVRRSGGLFGGISTAGRWQIAAYHTIQLSNRILIRPGVEEIDLLSGSAIGSTGGRPRHEFELNGGWFNNGIGIRVKGKHQSATRVDGGTNSALRFSDLTTLDLQMFINFDNFGDAAKKIKFLKASRLTFRINNLFDDIQDVRDANGLVPLRFQPGFLDPVGRYVEISFRKRF